MCGRERDGREMVHVLASLAEPDPTGLILLEETSGRRTMFAVAEIV